MTALNDTILIVGAGPTGLTLAATLATHGARVEIIDASDGPVTESRALSVHARTLEQLEPLGVSQRLVELGRALGHALVMNGSETLATLDVSRIGDAERLPRTRYPFIVSLEQGATQRVLAERAEELGVAIRWRTRLEDFEAREDGVRVVTSHGTRRTAREYAWLVGCDGARSRVRSGAGIESENLGDSEGRWYLADVHLPDFEHDPDHLVANLHGAMPFAMIPLTPEGTWRVITPHVEEPEGGALSFPELSALIAERTTWELEVARVDWQSFFSVRHRLARTYRDGRVLLAGDAAHIHSPVGGQGMNTGMQDALALGWRLARVADGRSPEALLDQYGAERRPVAARLLGAAERATRNLTSESAFMGTLRRAAVRLAFGTDFVQSKVLPAMTMLDIDYSGFAWTQDVVGASAGASSSSERPGWGARRSFARAPAAGARVPSCIVGEGGEHLHDLLGGGYFHLVIFDGPEDTHEGYARAERAHALATEALGEDVRTHLVVGGSFDARRAGAWVDGARLVRDLDGRWAGAFGADCECAYLIRPDMHVGWRSQPVALDALASYLREAALH